MNPATFSFGVGVETHDQTGEILAVYFRIRKGKTAKTKEYADGNVFADYDKHGTLLGIEILAPCAAKVLDRIAETAPAKRFVKNSIPRSMIIAA